MKKLSFLLLIFSFFSTANAQIVNIPDANFKARLLAANSSNYIAVNLNNNYFKIDANSDGEIQESEALNVSFLDVERNQIASLVGIEKFTKLRTLICNNNELNYLEVNKLINLKDLICNNNQLSSLNVSGLNNLKVLNCNSNAMKSLNITGLINLEELNCDFNLYTSLDVTGLTNLKHLNCNSNGMESLNINGLINLQVLYCNSNSYTSLNLTGLKNLQILDCKENKLKSLDIGSLLKLTRLSCSSNQLISLNVALLVNLTTLSCGKNQLNSLNVTSLVNLTGLSCGSNNFGSLDLTNNRKLEALDISISNTNYALKKLFIKNGSNDMAKVDIESQRVGWYRNAGLEYICADEFEIESINRWLGIYEKNTIISSYCSFVPGGSFYTIQGNQKLDSNNNGCDANDIIMPNLKYNITNGSITGSIISDTSGNYSIPVQDGTHTITPKLENPTYFTVSPTTVNVTFPTQTSPFTQNFCITANGVRPDLEVTLLPLQPARPGFDAKYKLVYKNKGNTIQSGAVNLTFNDAVLDLVMANPLTSIQSTNTLSWNFTSLQPFETREITFTMNVNSPMEIPAVINGDILNFTTTITSSATDETPTDNTFTFNQTVVGSYDPNDKTCLEGSVITPNLIGQYVHYTIRFENTGTFAAENVVVKDMIDLTKFDISTLVPTSASHLYTTRITEGNKVEFIFENINLPFDDANNDGYIAFKIKTKPTLVVNDSFSNEASIFFDYNFPIVTNKATSTFKTLGTPDFDFDRYFTVYPNPAKDILNIATKESINTQSMQVYNTLGQLVLVITNAEKTSNIDVSSLESGNYFIQIKTDKGSSSSQFVKD